MWRIPIRSVSCLAWLCCVLAGTALAQTVPAEATREEWQKVEEILTVMAVRPGSTVADIGAGDGFFTIRLARAVGPEGRVFAVDVDDEALARLRQRIDADSLRNVYVVKGTPSDPKLPDHALDAALIVNAYHEMPQHLPMLKALRQALKPAGRLVIVEPIGDAARGRPRPEQEHDHQIAPEFVLADARAAGFRVVGLQDPFTSRGRDIEWLIALLPAEAAAATPTPTASSSAAAAAEQKDPAIRISAEDFLKLVTARKVTIVDVRDAESFGTAHIPGAISIPLDSIATAIERIRRLGQPVVTYCS
jgi:predicted methyltransferase